MKIKGKANAQGMMFDFTMDLMAQEPDNRKCPWISTSWV